MGSMGSYGVNRVLWGSMGSNGLFPQLFLDDAKVKNFTTCFKDERFLSFFFLHLQPNVSGRYVDSFPFVSLCGPEWNFVSCQDLPIVFNRLLDGPDRALLSYCNGGSRLVVPFQPQALTYWPPNGRVYHPGPEGGGGMGLVTSALVELWGDGFRYGAGDGESPTHLVYGGRTYELEHPLLERLRERERLWGERDPINPP
ncbi:UPF0598 protein C8orf82 homolog [Excalfactoria chinensis]|uniref:UPF0598 protein C8orf82 homolog n=1 Tax=Excalfactoria chinensis TaxID=46218 RepID=UPI003B3A917C